MQLGDIDDEFAELMEGWAEIAPSIERTCQHEDRLNRIEKRLNLQDGESNG